MRIESAGSLNTLEKSTSPMSPARAAADLDLRIKYDPIGYQNLETWSIFVKRGTGECRVCVSESLLVDPQRLVAMLREMAAHIESTAVILPGNELIVPHAS